CALWITFREFHNSRSHWSSQRRGEESTRGMAGRCSYGTAPPPGSAFRNPSSRSGSRVLPFTSFVIPFRYLPVPDNETVCMPAPSVIDTVAVRVPAVGLKVMVRVQLAPISKLLPHPFFREVA